MTLTTERTHEVTAAAGPRTRAARAALARALKENRESLRASSSVPAVVVELPKVSRRRRWGCLRRGGLWGPAGVAVPKHVTSAARVGVLTPFVAPATTSIPGPVLGIEATSGQPFTFDPWGAVQAGLVTSPGVVVFGLQGTGKSFCVKTAMLRAIGWGRQVIVSSDPKGEWVALAEALGGQIVAVGPGSGNVINPRRPARSRTTRTRAHRRACGRGRASQRWD